MIYGIIAERRLGGSDHQDLLSMYMKAVDQDTGIGMTDQQVRDEVMSIFLAGHETTANALTWLWYLLSLNPGVEKKIRLEIDAVLGGREPGLADFPRLKYTEMAFQESLRLYPPVWLIGRRCTAADHVGAYAVPKGAIVILSPFITHRDAKYWPDPERFEPERFTTRGGAAGVARFDYFPFAGGPRACIGQRFATMEAVTVIARILQEFELERISLAPATPDSSITLRPRHPIIFKIRNR